MTLIINADIVTQNKRREIIYNGAVLIKGDKIKDIGKTEDLCKKYKKIAKKIISGKNKVVMPGLINAHTHLAMALLRGYADDLPLEKWWFEKIFPAEAKLTNKDIYWGSLLGGLEMIKSGTTTFVDFYFFANSIAQAVEKLGIRANIGIPIMDLEAPDFKTPDEALDALPKIIAKWKNNDLIKFSIAPHMLQTISIKTYKKCKKIADHYNLILQTHLAETEQEIKHSIKKYKKTPIKLLNDNKILAKNFLAAHCCHLTNKDIELLANSKANIIHCPSSNMKLSSGVMPLSKLEKAGINISLGTDSACSNNSLDMFCEMKIAALLHKIADKDPTSAKAQTILDMATINGAQALGLEKQIGSLEKGKKADIIMIDFNQPHLLPRHNIVSNIVYSGRGSDVETVFIDGKMIMHEKKVLIVSEKNIMQKIKADYPKKFFD